MTASRHARTAALFASLSLAALGLSCSNDNAATSNSAAETADSVVATTAPALELPTVVVTYSVLASVVSELVEGAANVVTLIPDGQDPHNFEPSAKDLETINNAALVVANGLDLEEGLNDALANAQQAGVNVFYLADHVTVLDIVDVNDHSDHGHVHRGADASHSDDDHGDEHGDEDGDEHSDEDDDDHSHSQDPHVWLSPHTVREALPALAKAASDALNVDLAAAQLALDNELAALDTELLSLFSAIDNCQLVTGHNELGYFVDRYGCTVVAAIISSTSTNAEASARNTEFVIDVIKTHSAKVIFTSLGTNPKTAEQVAREADAQLVTISTHFLGTSNDYVAFMRTLGTTIATSLS
jgi:zinc/manganese transport system substrate-binding protein